MADGTFAQLLGGESTSRLSRTHEPNRFHNSLSDGESCTESCYDTLQLWKDADRNIPILNKAKAKYAKLR